MPQLCCAGCRPLAAFLRQRDPDAASTPRHGSTSVPCQRWDAGVEPATDREGSGWLVRALGRAVSERPMDWRACLGRTRRMLLPRKDREVEARDCEPRLGPGLDRPDSALGRIRLAENRCPSTRRGWRSARSPVLSPPGSPVRPPTLDPRRSWRTPQGGPTTLAAGRGRAELPGMSELPQQAGNQRSCCVRTVCTHIRRTWLGQTRRTCSHTSRSIAAARQTSVVGPAGSAIGIPERRQPVVLPSASVNFEAAGFECERSPFTGVAEQLAAGAGW